MHNEGRNGLVFFQGGDCLNGSCAIKQFRLTRRDVMKHHAEHVQARHAKELCCSPGCVLAKPLLDAALDNTLSRASTGVATCTTPHFRRQLHEYHELKAQWLELSEHERVRTLHLRGSAAASLLQQQVKGVSFPAYDSPQYGGAQLTPGMMKTCILLHAASFIKETMEQLSLLTSPNVMVDEAMKLAKKGGSKGSRSGNSVLAAHNGFGVDGHLLYTLFCHNRNADDVFADYYPHYINRCQERDRANPLPNGESHMPLAFVSDNPETLEKKLAHLFNQERTLYEKGVPYHRFSSGPTIIIDHAALAPSAISSFLADLRADRLVGLDAEWEYNGPGVEVASDKVSAFGVCNGKTVLLFPTCRIGFLPCLKNLLEDPTIVFVGFTLSADKHKFELDDVCLNSNMVDVAKVARENGYWPPQIPNAPVKGRNLANLTKIMLNKNMLKNDLLRCSFNYQKEFRFTEDQAL